MRHRTEAKQYPITRSHLPGRQGRTAHKSGTTGEPVVRSPRVHACAGHRAHPQNTPTTNTRQRRLEDHGGGPPAGPPHRVQGAIKTSTDGKKGSVSSSTLCFRRRAGGTGAVSGCVVTYPRTRALPAVLLPRQTDRTFRRGRDGVGGGPVTQEHRDDGRSP